MLGEAAKDIAKAQARQKADYYERRQEKQLRFNSINTYQKVPLYNFKRAETKVSSHLVLHTLCLRCTRKDVWLGYKRRKQTEPSRQLVEDDSGRQSPLQ